MERYPKMKDMFENKSVIIVFVIVGILVSSGAGYFYSNSKYTPIISDLQVLLIDKESTIDDLSIELNETIEEKKSIISSLDSQLNECNLKTGILIDDFLKDLSIVDEPTFPI